MDKQKNEEVGLTNEDLKEFVVKLKETAKQQNLSFVFAWESKDRGTSSVNFGGETSFLLFMEKALNAKNNRAIQKWLGFDTPEQYIIPERKT